MLWHEQSWPQLDKLDRQTPVIVPVASCEQHGRHLPVFVDTMQVTSIAEAVERDMTDRVLLTPTLWLGSSHHHYDFPGTISAKPSLFSEMIKTIARSILNAGFERIFFLNGHGGNETPGSQALTELVAEDDKADAAMLAFGSWWFIGKDALDPETLGMRADNISPPYVSHACEYETSLMMYIREDLAHPELAETIPGRVNNKWSGNEYNRRVGVYHRWRYYTPHGSYGNPQNATREKGKAIHDGVTAEVKAFITEFAQWPKLDIIGPKR